LAVHLAFFTNFAKHVHVGFWFPRTESRARACATGATLFAVRAIVDAKFFFEMEWLVVALFVFVTDYFVWARDNAAGTTCAQTSVNDFFVELFPLMGPALGSGWGSFSNGHVTTLRHIYSLVLGRAT
jgi:hypothetical protein